MSDEAIKLTSRQMTRHSTLFEEKLWQEHQASN
jgi:hypothetical protein